MTYVPDLKTLRVMKIIHGVKHYFEDDVLVHIEGQTSLVTKVGMAAVSAAAILQNPKKDNELGAARLAVCETCPNYTDKRCKLCMCFMPIKTTFIASKCPANLWSE